MPLKDIFTKLQLQEAVKHKDKHSKRTIVFHFIYKPINLYIFHSSTLLLRYSAQVLNYVDFVSGHIRVRFGLKTNRIYVFDFLFTLHQLPQNSVLRMFCEKVVCLLTIKQINPFNKHNLHPTQTIV